MYKTILAATDGSVLATGAVSHAAGLARALGARLVIVTVTPERPYFDPAELGVSLPLHTEEHLEMAYAARAQKTLAAGRRAAGTDIIVEVMHVPEREVHEGILEAAARMEADLIVMAARSQSGLNRFLLGSQTSKVLGHSQIPVLVVKA